MPAGDIEAMFSVRQNAWHDPTGRFTRDRYPRSIAEARQWAGHDWEPLEAEAFERIKVDDPATFRFGDQDVVVELPDGRYVFRPIAGEKRVIRSDTGSHMPCGARKPRIRVVSRRSVPSLDALHALVDRPPAHPSARLPQRR